MKKEMYRTWLAEKMKPASISDRLSRCACVEKALGVDLDIEYKKDKGNRILQLLHYSINDMRTGKKLPKGFHFKEGADVNRRMTDLRSAVGRYFDFCSSMSEDKA